MLLFHLFFVHEFFAVSINWKKKLKRFFPTEEKYDYGLYALNLYQRVYVSSDWMGTQDFDHIKFYIKELESFLESSNGFFRKMIKNPMLVVKDLQNPKHLTVDEQDFQKCFFKPVYQLPNKRVLEKILCFNGYRSNGAIKLATGYYNSDQLLIALLLLKQNEPFNTYILGQKSMLHLVNEIMKESYPCAYTFLSKDKADPILLTYIASTGLDFTEDELELLEQKLSLFYLKKIRVNELKSIFEPYDVIFGNQLHSSVVIGALLQQSRVINEER